MNFEHIKQTPEPTLRRLPRYLHFLIDLKTKGVQEVSSTIIANELGLDPVQVRKDIEYSSIIGKPRTGYHIDELIKALSKFLSWDTVQKAFLAGAGNLGSAMLGYKNFINYGLHIIAAFDKDPNKINTIIYDIPVYDINELTNMAKAKDVEIGIITVRANAAQDVANRMVDGGIKAIWNFAPVHIKVPKEVIVENAQLSIGLSFLKRKMFERNLL
ncbi:MAG TPA: redox-sensing transcriptional repressor Rex [Bacteroidota bacterium]|nr:redox-sensing transcriptional repressor Rex [Bacteroidota bacterium]